MTTEYTFPADMTCARVEPLLSEWVDGALAPDLRAAVETHLDGCEACANLAADLAAIAGEARALPPLQPERDLWAGIAARIEAPVVALDPQRVTRAPVAARPWWRTAAAAAALVVVTAGATAGVTWRVAASRVRTEARELALREAALREAALRERVVASATPAPRDTGTTAGDSGVPDQRMPDEHAPPVREPRSLEATPGTGSRAGATVARAPRAPRAAAPAPAVVAVALPPLPAAAQAYDREIAAMRQIVAARTTGLDTATVRVLERNLQIIDGAIAESRAALARDPASGLLAEQLTRAMRRKLDLLRTAADLPARIS